MNKWECDHPGCGRFVLGCGGALGLRAIGWYFVRGGPTFCPEHRPDPIPCCDSITRSIAKSGEGPQPSQECRFCAAEVEANFLQDAIRRELDMPAREFEVFVEEGVRERRKKKPFAMDLLVVAKTLKDAEDLEREACAAIAEDDCRTGLCGAGEYACHKRIAAAIRARGQA